MDSKINKFTLKKLKNQII